MELSKFRIDGILSVLRICKSHPIKEWSHNAYILRGENDVMCEYDYEEIAHIKKIH